MPPKAPKKVVHDLELPATRSTRSNILYDVAPPLLRNPHMAKKEPRYVPPARRRKPKVVVNDLRNNDRIMDLTAFDFLGLDKQVVKSLLSGWFSLSDIAKIDASYCNKVYQKVFRLLLCEIRLLSNHDSFCNRRFFLWVRLRELKLVTVHLKQSMMTKHGNFYGTELHENLQISTEFVESVILNRNCGSMDQAIVEFANQCPRLTSLSFQCLNQFSDKHFLLLNALRSLKVLSVENGSQISRDIIRILNEKCPKLLKFKFH
jgi:hypothetical protein